MRSVVVNQRLEDLFKAPSSCLPPSHPHTPSNTFQAPYTLIICGIPYHVSYTYIHHGQARVTALSKLSMLMISNSALIAGKHRPLPQAFHWHIDLDQFSTHLIYTGCQYQKKQRVDTKSVVNFFTKVIDHIAKTHFSLPPHSSNMERTAGPFQEHDDKNTSKYIFTLDFTMEHIPEGVEASDGSNSKLERHLHRKANSRH